MQVMHRFRAHAWMDFYELLESSPADHISLIKKKYQGKAKLWICRT